MVENFMWTVGLAINPQLGKFRRAIMSMVNALITTMDDIYDVHGTLDELKLFTEVINRLVYVFFLVIRLVYVF